MSTAHINIGNIPLPTTAPQPPLFSTMVLQALTVDVIWMCEACRTTHTIKFSFLPFSQVNFLAVLVECPNCHRKGRLQ